jgi:hypothetical protein
MTYIKESTVTKPLEKISKMKISRILWGTLKAFVFGVVIPIIVLLIYYGLQDLIFNPEYVEKYYFDKYFYLFYYRFRDEEIIFIITFLYFVFLLLSKFIGRKSWRRILLALFTLIPIIYFFIFLDYAGLAEILYYSLTNVVYYLLFFVALQIFRLASKGKKMDQHI